jgi:plasmid stabilization system protein ParE
MNRELVVEPEAEAEIDEASRWYDTQNPGLGTNFLRAVGAALAVIQRNPFQYQVIYREVRRAQLRRFPYGLIYTVTEQEIIVAACVHGRRSPESWQDRM